MTHSSDILTFWFGSPTEPTYGKPRNAWFIKDPEFDQTIRHNFFETYQQAINGQYDSWRNHPESCLALILIFDQFSRNLFRNTPQAFATDSQALKLAKYADSQQFDQQVLPVQRWFLYLPFEHSENLADQQRSLELFKTLKDDPDSHSTVEYAQRHYDVIARFGRFPHRNAILGRESTPEELEFLRQPNSSF